MQYEPIGDEVSVEGSICQAAQALDLAGMIATDARDSGRLLETAEQWKNLADFIVALSEHEEKQQNKKDKTELAMGFRPTPVTPEKSDITEEENEDVRDESGDDSDEGAGVDGVHTQHGQLRVVAYRRGSGGFRTGR